MTIPVWPGSLPWNPLLGLVLRRLPPFVETQMDAGSPKSRAIFSGALHEVDVPFIFTGRQWAYFNAWLASDLQGGGLPFTWAHPATDAAATFALRADAIEYRLEEGGAPDGERLWSVTIPMRIIP